MGIYYVTATVYTGGDVPDDRDAASDLRDHLQRELDARGLVT